MTTFGIPVEPDVSINLATVSPVILARESSTADVGPATESSLNDTLVSEVGGPSTQTMGTSFRSSASILMTENSASSACHREPARPETHLQATAGSQRDSVLSKSCYVRSLSRERPSSGEWRLNPLGRVVRYDRDALRRTFRV